MMYCDRLCPRVEVSCRSFLPYIHLWNSSSHTHTHKVVFLRSGRSGEGGGTMTAGDNKWPTKQVDNHMQPTNAGTSRKEARPKGCKKQPSCRNAARTSNKQQTYIYTGKEWTDSWGRSRDRGRGAELKEQKGERERERRGVCPKLCFMHWTYMGRGEGAPLKYPGSGHTHKTGGEGWMCQAALDSCQGRGFFWTPFFVQSNRFSFFTCCWFIFPRSSSWNHLSFQNMHGRPTSDNVCEKKAADRVYKKKVETGPRDHK